MKLSVLLKMGRNFSYLLSAAFLAATLLFGLLPVGGASAAPGGGNPGAIWTTSGDCGDESQDVNHFAIGDQVYINGSGFDANTSYSWQIKGQPGGASADPNIVVASGTVMTDGSGNFCINAYTVATDDDGEYSVKVGTKGDNYRVDGSTPPPPVDLCPNIEGVQATIPDGMEVNGEGNCVPVIPPPVDLCPNIEGVQETLPEGMKVDEEGNCVPLSDPFGLDFYCLGFTVINLNDFPADFDWEVEGGPSGSGSLDIGESVDIDVDPAFAGALVTISFGEDWSLSGNLPTDCERPFIDLEVEGFCSSGSNATSYFWRVTNLNDYDVDFEWRVNGSALAGLATVGANDSYEFSTPKSEGSIIMIYIGGVFQSDATAAQCGSGDDTPFVPQGEIPVVGGEGGPVLIPVTAGTPILIPVTGVDNNRGDLTRRVFMNLGFGFFGLGLVMHGLSRRKSAL
jgi:hypothetical protein